MRRRYEALGPRRRRAGFVVLVLAAATGVFFGVSAALAGVSVNAPVLTVYPPNPSNSTTATFKWTDSPPSLTFKCRLDAGAYEPCVKSGKTYTGLVDGTHTFGVIAIDGQGQESDETVYTWLIRTLPPDLVLSFPSDGTTYSGASWDAGCATPGVCGTASDPAGVTKVQVGLRIPGGSWWDGTSFSSPSPIYLDATLSDPGGTSTSWSFSFQASQFPADGSYRVSYRAFDAAGNATPISTVAPRIDMAAPTIHVSFPSTDGVYGEDAWNGGCTTAGACGSANDSAGVSAVRVAVRRVSTDEYWDGTSFASSTPVFISATLGTPGGNTTTWSFPFPVDQFPAQGSYETIVQATDSVGNTTPSGGYARTPFQIDLAPPAITIDFPAQALYGPAKWNAGCTPVGFCGGATDIGGVAAVSVAIGGGGLWWDGTSFSSSSAVFVNATLGSPGGSSTTWSYAFPFAQFPSSGQYTLIVRARDKFGHSTAANSKKKRVFTIDNVSPAIALAFPADGALYGSAGWTAGCSPAGICGTASDSSGVEEVRVAVKQGSTGNYWDGSSFSSSTPVFIAASLATPGAQSTPWSYGFPVERFPADGDYLVRVLAKDTPGNETPSASYVEALVHLEVTPPATTLAFPIAGATYGPVPGPKSWDAGCAPPGVCGSASDPHDVNAVDVAIRQVSTLKYWDGSSFSSATRVFLPATLASPGSGTTAWSFAFPSSNFPASGSYRIYLRGTDGLGNQSASNSTPAAQFRFDRDPPPAPAFTAKPPDSGTEGDVTFAFTDSESGVSFSCSRDGDPYAACTSPVVYLHLPPGTYTFCVKAVDSVGNESSATCHDWTITAVSFSIGGSPLAGVKLYPGGAEVPINLTFTNPATAPIHVTGVDVTITGTSAGVACDASNFEVARQFTAGVTLPAGATDASLADLGVPESDWPALRMLETGGNQNACQSATVELSYSGTGTG